MEAKYSYLDYTKTGLAFFWRIVGVPATQTCALVASTPLPIVKFGSV
jgi:hypothetical protein